MTPIPARLLGVRQSAQYLGVGRSTVYNLLDGGEIESVHVLGRRLVPIEVLDAYVARLRDAAAK